MSGIGFALERAVRDLRDAVHDFDNDARIETATERLRALTLILDAEPLKSFLLSVLPPANFDEWLQSTVGHEYSSGHFSVPWPAEQPMRVALQISLCRLMVSGIRSPLDFCRRYYRGDSPRHTDYFRRFSSGVLHPLVRDIARLGEQRTLPSELAAMLRIRPRSEDEGLDGLIAEACEFFSDPAPTQRQRALERLWDAWERAKTTLDSDKKRGSQLLIARACAGPEFAQLLETEARTLTEVGNSFSIRHFEASQIGPLEPEHVDYLFHRMLALLQFLLRRSTS